jgi:uncharacterized membrane protein
MAYSTISTHMSTKPLTARSLLHSIVLSKGRMEALTDGIFAIAMTLLVLELKIPDLPKSVSTSELLQNIGHEAPAFFSFMVSFLYCGLLWVLHHLAMHFVRHLQIVLVWLNLLFLMSISVMPFSCGLLGHFLRNPAAQEIYFGNMFAAAGLLAVQWLVAKKKKLLNEDEPLKTQLLGQQIIVFPVGLCAAMAAVHFISPQAGFYALTAVLLSMRVAQRIWFRRQTNP